MVRLPPQVGSEEWRRLNGIHQMHPGPGRRDQRATHSHPYLRRDSSRHPRELQGPGEPGRCSGSLPSSGDLPPLTTTSNSSPAHSASPPLQSSSHLHTHGSATKSPAELVTTPSQNVSNAGSCAGVHRMYTPGVIGTI